MCVIGQGINRRDALFLFIAGIAVILSGGCFPGVDGKVTTNAQQFKIDKGDNMYLETLVVGDIDANCYVIAAESGGESIVIDPGGDAQVILDTVAAANLKVEYVILTHAHIDHFAAAAELAEKTGSKIGVHKLDRDALTNPRLSLAQMFGSELDIDPETIIELEDGQVIEVGDLEAEIIHTPGHSPGSISVRTGDRLFTGDLLFYRSIGRTDFPGGSHEGLLKSVRERIFIYPDHVKVYPGHGPSTSVGEEKQENPYFD